MADKLTPQQQAAVDNRGGQLLVSAAAGSGKTKVLVDRLMSYISDPVAPANIDDFLIITYTKAAAAELRGKIAQKLSQRIAEDPKNRHLQQQMQRLYMAKISTVHSFCADILRENAYRMDISADFRVADENECIQLQQQALDQLLNEAYNQIDANDGLRDLIDTQGFGRDDRSIPQILLKVYHSAKCHLDPEGWLAWCAKQNDADGITDASQTVWGQYLIEDLHRYLDLNIQALENCVFRASANDTLEKPCALFAQTITQLRSLRSCSAWDQILAHPPIDYGRLTFSKMCTDLQLIDQMKAIRDACKTGMAAKLRSFMDNSQQILKDLRSCSASAAALIALVRQFGEYYDQLKSRKRVLDFSDLEHKMLDLLLGKKRIGVTVAAVEIGSRFREIMVDEYQDSNGVQDAIFAALTDRRKNCFMVGDVKQSIYQFRLADPNIFIEKYDTFLSVDQAVDGQGRKVLLSKNFRSSAGVIQAVNDVFTNCMSARVGGLDYTADEMLYEGIPHRPIGEAEVELYGVSVQDDTYEEESSFVAERICQLLDGTHFVRQGDELRPVRPGDIVILLRSPGSVGAQFKFALQMRGIQCNSGDGTDLLQTEEVSVLISLLQTIVNPQQDIPLLSVLTSRVFGFTADEMARIRSKKRYCSIFDAVCADQSQKAVSFVQTLNTLRINAQRFKLTQLIEDVFLRTGILDTYFAVQDGEVKRTNLMTVLQLAVDFSAGGGQDLIQFLECLQSLEERGLVVSAEQSDMDCVTIMSIHKSKGLEFPVVFLCGLSRSFNKESTREQVLCHKELGVGMNFVNLRQRVRYPTIAKRAIAAKIMEESISEELRVLYVAMTRARDRLIMTYARRNLSADLHNTAMRLELSPKELLTGQVNCPGDWVIQTALSKSEAGEFFRISGNSGCAMPSQIPWYISIAQSSAADVVDEFENDSSDVFPVELLEQMRDTLSFDYAYKNATSIPSKQTATQLKGRLKDQEVAENTVSKHRVSFRRPRFVKPVASGKEYGTALHVFMQYADYSACITEESIRTQMDYMVSAGLLTREQAAMIEPSNIVSFFSTSVGKALINHHNVLREFKFSILVDAKRYYPDVVDEQVLLQGVIDCAMIDEDGITVIDFKTDRVTQQTMSDAVQRYAEQVQAYKEALERLYRLPVKSTCLYFFSIGEFAYL